MLAKRCGILINKGVMEQTCKIVWEHEIPVLEFKYGPGNITRQKIPRYVYRGDNKPQVEMGIQRFPIVEIDHDEEYSRLMNTYGRHEQENKYVCEMAYGYMQERKMEQLNELKYRPLILAGHHFIEKPKIEEKEYDDGLGEIFDEVPEDKLGLVKEKLATVKLPTIDPADNDEFLSAEDAEKESLPPLSDSPHVTEEQAAQARAGKKKETPEPLSDIDTMFKIENMTVPGIKEMLVQRGVPHNPDDNKANLHKLFMDSMKPVGVDMDDED